MLAQRLLTAAIGIPIVIGVILIGGHLFTAVACVILGIAALEFVHMARREERPLWQPSAAAIAAVAVVVAVTIAADVAVDEWPPELVAVVGVAMLYVLVRGLPETAMTGWLAIVAAILYVGILGSYLVLLRNLDDGERWVLLVVLSTWGTDTCAYAVGKLIGRHKMAPRISPGKTWEGTAGGLVGGLIVVVALNWPLDLPVSTGQAVVLGLILPAVAVLADLGESALKRGAGVKDTSVLVPGHGGLLDRLDSLLFTVPLVYYFAVWVVL
ncbi:MAG TPA: phosphatidate cytidylyltransferase [Dehalococcoidia bacterium]|jgi:phosphatidate cytidylyltransferase